MATARGLAHSAERVIERRRIQHKKILPYSMFSFPIMNWLSTVFLVVLLANSPRLVAQEGVDSLLYVMTHFFENYRVPYPVSFHVEFCKRPDGYYVRKFEFGEENLREQKLYDLKEHSFQVINVFEYTNGRPMSQCVYANDELIEYGVIEKLEEYQEKRSFFFKDAELFPFYGYRGFYRDVISFYENKQELSTNELYALGRAYGRRISGGLISSREVLAADDFGLVAQDGIFDTLSLAKYLAVYERQNAVYRELMRRDADFVTSKGSAKSYYAHMVMGGVVNLLFRQAEVEALAIIDREDLYDSATLDEAKAILGSCPEDAVLFTWEERDTYPLHYVQLKEGFREDVIIVNMSLLVLPAYIRYVYNGAQGGSNLGRPSFLTKYDDYFAFRRGNYAVAQLDATVFLRDIEQGMVRDKDKEIHFPREINVDKVRIRFSSDCEQGIDKELLITLPQFFFIDLVMVVDLLNQRCPARTVCVSERARDKALQPISDYLKKSGRVFLIE